MAKNSHDKTIITTCNTSQQAAGAYVALKYLGYPKVKLHDGSYLNWEKNKGSRTGATSPPPAKKTEPPPEEDDEEKFGC